MKAVDKREGGGAYNWGSVEDELKGAQDTANATGMVTQKMEKIFGKTSLLMHSSNMRVHRCPRTPIITEENLNCVFVQINFGGAPSTPPRLFSHFG